MNSNLSGCYNVNNTVSLCFVRATNFSSSRFFSLRRQSSVFVGLQIFTQGELCCINVLLLQTKQRVLRTSRAGSSRSAPSSTMDETNKSTHFDLLGLPTELKRRTAYFLATHDVVHLSQTSVALQQALALRPLQPRRSLMLPPPPRPTDATLQLRRVVARVPVWNRRVHTLGLTVDFQQESNTQRATCLYVSAYPSHADTPPPLVLQGETDEEGLGRIVGSTWGRGTQPQTWFIRWCPREGEIYYVWCTLRSVWSSKIHLHRAMD